MEEEKATGLIRGKNKERRESRLMLFSGKRKIRKLRIDTGVVR